MSGWVSPTIQARFVNPWNNWLNIKSRLQCKFNTQSNNKYLCTTCDIINAIKQYQSIGCSANRANITVEVGCITCYNGSLKYHFLNIFSLLKGALDLFYALNYFIRFLCVYEKSDIFMCYKIEKFDFAWCTVIKICHE